MKKTFLVSFITAAVVAMFTFTAVQAAGPMDFVKNIGKTVDADPNKSYVLTEIEGPYLIYLMAFSGPTARQDAHTLALELRRTYKWNAYVHEITFAPNASQDFKSSPQSRTKPKYLNATARTDIAVLVGNFLSLEDKQFEKTLAEMRKCKPATLKNTASPVPFSMAHGVSNPMLPPEHQNGFVDPYIAKINGTRPYSLLHNPRRYTVQIATFRGDTAGYKWQEGWKSAEDAKKNTAGMSILEKGEQDTVALCKALRDRGVEAYEFHDRYESIVTVGSFSHHSQMMPNGAVRMDPQVQQVIEQYQRKVNPQTGEHMIVRINGIACDVQPKVIEVPRVRRTP